MAFLNCHLGLEATSVSSCLISSYGAESSYGTERKSNDDSGDAGYGVWTARAFLSKRANHNSPVKTFISSSKELDSLT